MAPSVRTLHNFALVTLWVGATLANLASVYGVQVQAVGLIAISFFISGMIIRGYRALETI